MNNLSKSGGKGFLFSTCYSNAKHKQYHYVLFPFLLVSVLLDFLADWGQLWGVIQHGDSFWLDHTPALDSDHSGILYIPPFLRWTTCLCQALISLHSLCRSCGGCSSWLHLRYSKEEIIKTTIIIIIIHFLTLSIYLLLWSPLIIFFLTLWPSRHWWKAAEVTLLWRIDPWSYLDSLQWWFPSSPRRLDSTEIDKCKWDDSSLFAEGDN